MDNGETWDFLSKAADTDGGAGGNGNPPSMVRLKDGRRCVTYGYRASSYGIRAKLSEDNGKSWGHEICLRDDGRNWDFGYTRTVQRTDGKLVTLYYYTTVLRYLNISKIQRNPTLQPDFPSIWHGCWVSLLLLYMKECRGK